MGHPSIINRTKTHTTLGEKQEQLDSGIVESSKIGNVWHQIDFCIDLMLVINRKDAVRFIPVAKRYGLVHSIQVLIDSIDDPITVKHTANSAKDQMDIAPLEKIKRGEDSNV